MKANEVPEKIYLNWVNYPLEEMQVEYTRTDAFIKRACEWLENNLQGIVGGSIYIEDFKNYMKRE